MNQSMPSDKRYYYISDLADVTLRLLFEQGSISIRPDVEEQNVCCPENTLPALYRTLDRLFRRKAYRGRSLETEIIDAPDGNRLLILTGSAGEMLFQTMLPGDSRAVSRHAADAISREELYSLIRALPAVSETTEEPEEKEKDGETL